MAYPQWATPERRAYLVELFDRCRGFCVYGHKPCPYPDHHFQNHVETLIGYWIQDDRSERAEQLRLEQEVLHAASDRHGWGRRFDPIAREKFFDHQSPYYIEGLGISGLTFKPIAKVRIPSTMLRLFVDVPKQDTRKLSKNQRRKARRYHHESVHNNCSLAVKHYWSTA